MQCPGQDSRYWSGEDVFEINCPKCGHNIEFFKDDSRRVCKRCGQPLLNPKMDFGCAQYCQHADQCLGSLSLDMQEKRTELFKDRVAGAMRAYFGADARRIAHAEAVAGHAEIIGKAEGGDLAVIMAAAFLHDIGIREAERKFSSSAPEHQHREGPPVARELLSSLKAEQSLIEEVCDIIGHHHWPRDNETINFKVLYDADLIVNLVESYQQKPPVRQRVEKIVAESFLTEGGRQEAERVLFAYTAQAEAAKK